VTVLAQAMRAVETKQRCIVIDQEMKKPTAQNLFVYFDAELRGKEIEEDGLTLVTSPLST
jgi:hypothetical protein